MKQRLYLLPFDHRHTFEEMVGAREPLTKDDVQKIKEYKQMIYRAFKPAKVSKAKTGILVDETYGKEILLDAKKNGFIFGYTLEKSGQDEFKFDRKDYKKKLRFFKPTYAKVLVRYNPEGNKALNKRQAHLLAGLSSYLKTQNFKLLVELLEIPTEKQLKWSKHQFDHRLRSKLMVKAIQELQSAGVDPDIWKLEGLDSTYAMKKVARQVTKFNPRARIIVLGRGENEKKAERWIKTSAKVKEVIGFAVGRTIFQHPLLDYQHKKIDKLEAINQIRKNYLHFIDVFEKARGGR